MADLELSIAIRAVNEASQILDKVRTDHERASQAVVRGSQDMERQLGSTNRQFVEATRVSRVMAAGLLTELNPTLGNIVTAMSSAATAMRGFGLAAGVAVGAAVAIVSEVVSYVQTAERLAEAQARANIAIKQFRLDGVRAQIVGLQTDLEKLSLDTPMNKLRALFETLSIGLASPFVGGVHIATEEEEIKHRIEMLTQDMVASAAHVNEASRILAEAGARRADALTSLFKTQADLGLKGFDEDLFVEAIERQATALQSALEAERERLQKQAEADARQRPDQAEAILKALGFDLETLQAKFNERFSQIGEVFRQGRVALQTTGARGAIPAGLNDPELEAALQTGLQATREFRLEQEKAVPIQLATQRELLQLRTQDLDLTREQRRDLDLLVIAAERDLAIAQAKGQVNEEAIADAARIKAAFQEYLRIQRDAADTNPLEGMRRGLADFEERFNATGRLMREAIQRVGEDMARSLSNLFFNVVTGQFKNLTQNFSQQLGAAVLRTVTDTMAQAAIGSLFRR